MNAIQGQSHGLNTRTRRTGATAIEMVAALFVITVGVFGVIQVYHVGMSQTRVIGEGGIVMRALQNELETLRSLPFRELKEGANQPFHCTPQLDKLVNARPSLTIAGYPGAEDRLKEVTVRLRWTGEHGRTIEKSLTTLIADKGLTEDQP